MRDLGLVRLSSWGRVVPAGGVVAFEVVGDDGCVNQPISEYLRDFKARGDRGRIGAQLRSCAAALVAVPAGDRCGMGPGHAGGVPGLRAVVAASPQADQ